MPAEGFDPAGLARAAAAGEAEAHHRLALLHGLGLGVPQDWALALDHARRAAEAGHELAMRSLALLGPDPDLEAWITPPPPQVLSQAPHVLAAEGFAAPELCAWLIERARPRLEPARVYDHATGEGRLEAARSNSAAAFALPDLDLPLLLLRERIARATGLPVSGMEWPQVLRYGPGEQFEPHCDWLDPARPGERADILRRGQRAATLLVYLNDAFEGGETWIEALDLKHRGRTGDALFWANITRDGRPDPATRHAGLPPTSGEKWVLSQWLRGRPAAG